MKPDISIPEEGRQKILKIKHESFALKYLPQGIKELPAETNICTTCSKAMWNATGTTLRAFCKVQHAIVYTTKDKQNILICDDNQPEEEPVQEVNSQPSELSSLPKPFSEQDLEAFITDETT